MTTASIVIPKADLMVPPPLLRQRVADRSLLQWRGSVTGLQRRRQRTKAQGRWPLEPVWHLDFFGNTKPADNQVVDLDTTNSSATNRKATDRQGADGQRTECDCAYRQCSYCVCTNASRSKAEMMHLRRRPGAGKDLRSIVNQFMFPACHLIIPESGGYDSQ